MYTLVLSKAERDAFDWIGGRYAMSDIANVLYDLLPIKDAWIDNGEVTFAVPEHVAWTIMEAANAEDCMWPCFAPSLAAKMQAFVDSIV